MIMTADELAIVLLELAQTPGQDEWIARWRPELADALVTVAQWALGRVSPEVVRRLPEGRWPEELGTAALVFLKRVCFAPDANYYEVFGLTPEATTPQEVRARYRALIRLTHPDVGLLGLPPDAAGLVNRAYAVLNDDGAREVYDKQLAASEPSSTAHGAGDDSEAQGLAAEVKPGDGRVAFAARASVSERVLARWVMVNARWSRQLQMSLIGVALLVPVGVLLLWGLSGQERTGTIVALSSGPDEDSPPATATLVAEQGGGSAGRGALAGRSGGGSGLLPAGVAEPGRPGASQVHAAAEVDGVSPVDTLQAEVAGGAVAAFAASGAELDGRGGGMADAPHEEGVGDGAGTDLASRAQSASPQVAAAGVADHPQEAVGLGKIANRDAAMGESPAAAPPPVPERQVDWPAARRYLQDITVAVESRTESESLNHYLETMNVKGSLLRPVMDLYQQYDSLTTEYSTWSMAEGHGLFDAETMLVIRAAASGVEPVMRSFLLRAQFEATENGTRLETLDLQPME